MAKKENYYTINAVLESIASVLSSSDNASAISNGIFF